MQETESKVDSQTRTLVIHSQNTSFSVNAKQNRVQSNDAAIKKLRLDIE